MCLLTKAIYRLIAILIKIPWHTSQMQNKYFKNLYERKSKQNITRDIEVKNNLTIAGGEGTVGRGDYRNYYKGHMDKIKGEGEAGEGDGFCEVRWRDGEKIQTTVIE